jgi:hypothetical protein
MNRTSSSPIPKPIVQLQRQLDQFRSNRQRRTKLPESLWQAAVELPDNTVLFRHAPATAGLYGAGETARRSSRPPTKGTLAASGDSGGLHHRVRDHRVLANCDREWITLTGQVKQRPCNS